MKHTVDLAAYLPPFLAEYREIRAALEAENPEFAQLWEAADHVLANQWISTADAYGISRFERVLGIHPSAEDSLETRRFRVQTQWFNTIPYTVRRLVQLLTSLCGPDGYTVTVDPETYTVQVKLAITVKGQEAIVRDLLGNMIPANLLFSVSLAYHRWEDVAPYPWAGLSSRTWREIKEEVLS